MPTVLIFHPERCQPEMSPSAAISFDSVELRSGTNELTPDAIEQVQKHPDFQRFSKIGAIELVQKTEMVDLQANIEIVGLGDYAVEQAQTIVNNTNDLETLDSWLKSETRPKIRTTIATRITQVKSGSL